MGGVLDGFRNGKGHLLFTRAGRGVGGVSRARFPPGPHPRLSRFSRLPPLRLPPTKRLFKTKNPQALSPKPLEPGPKLRGLACCTDYFLSPYAHQKFFEKPRLPRLVAPIDFLSPSHPKLGAGRRACWS